MVKVHEILFTGVGSTVEVQCLFFGPITEPPFAFWRRWRGAEGDVLQANSRGIRKHSVRDGILNSTVNIQFAIEYRQR